MSQNLGIYLRRGFFVWLWNLLVTLLIAIVVFAVFLVLGTRLDPVQMLIAGIAIYILLIPVSLIALGWAASKALKKGP